MGLLGVALAGCKETEPSAPVPPSGIGDGQTLAFSPAVSNLFIDETASWGLTVTDKDGNSSDYSFDPTAVVLECSPAGIVELDINSCSVKAISYGTATVTARSTSSSATATYTVHVLNADKVKQELSASMVLTGKLSLPLNTTIQGFDLSDDRSSVYYSQLGVGNNNYTLNVCRRDLASGSVSAGPQLVYAGHGQGLAIEEDGDDVWCWLCNYGTLGSAGYESSQTISRFPFSRGMSWLPEECESNFWIPERRNLQISLDARNDIAMIYSVGNSSSIGYYYGWRLSEMKALQAEEQTLSFDRTYGGAGPVASKVTEKSVADVKNLGKLTPVFQFRAEAPLIAGQGYSCSGGKIFIVKGVPVSNSDGTYTNECELYIMDTTGTLLKSYDLTDCFSNAAVRSVLGSDIGFFEPEGIQVYDGCLYIGFGSRVTEGSSVVRKPVILKYDLTL